MTRALLLLPVLLAACQPVVVLPTEPDGGIGDTPDTCGAGALSALVGSSGTVLDTARFAQPIRVIRPGDMVTMDFNPSRINFELDAQGRIARVYCG